MQDSKQLTVASDLVERDQLAIGDEPPTNFTANPTFAAVMDRRFSRRDMMRGSLQAAVAGLFAASTASTMRGQGLLPPAAGARPPFGLEGTIGFLASPVYNGDDVSVAPGYTARPFLTVGTPIVGPDVGTPAAASVTAFEQCSGAEMEQRIGSHHDGMHYFPFPDDPDGHGLLCLNHEYIDARKLFPEGAWVSTGTRPGDQVRKGVAAHGVSIVEIRRIQGTWQVVGGPYNRRVTGETPMEIAGPVRGSALVVTKYSPDGTRTRGTLNNCAHGYTPWRTYLTCEENWASYFAAGAAQASGRREFRRVGVGANSSRYGWDLADSQPTASAANPDPYARFNASPTGATAAEDYRNEPNGQGWIVEIDPWNPSSTPVKRTSMGRFAHEGCVFATPQPGQPLVFYSGDDATNQYIYKFVTRDRYQPGRTSGSILDRGVLYAAKFYDDGTGEWLALDVTDRAFQASVARAVANPRSVWPGGQYDDFNGFVDQADVLVNTRLAADVAGATPMDRPEWGAVHPQTNEVYFTLTNNNRRGLAATNNQNPVPAPVDEANPRAASAFGHIIRWREQGNRPWAARFAWDLFLLSGPTENSRDLAGQPLTSDSIHASPDGLWIDGRGVLWIQTDMGSSQQIAETNRFGNNQMLAANPHTGEIRRFFTGCRGQEGTGGGTTPERRTRGSNLQHPGEGSESNPILGSTYPDGPGSRGRSCTIVITKDDGGIIGS